MKIRWMIAFFILSLLVLPVQAADIHFLTCREADSTRIHIGYESDVAYADVTTYAVLESSGLFGTMPERVESGNHPSLWGVDLYDENQTVLVGMYNEDFAVERVVSIHEPLCASGTGQPDGAFESITIFDVEGEAFTWEVRDAWGNWHDITDVTTPLQCEDDRCFTRLVLGPGGSADVEDYRVTAVESD